jgi:glutamate N-acetyltransferase/amino-acid N-acetyltransferase
METEKYRVNGFTVSAAVAGLKKGGVLDMALIVAEKECAAAGVFTANKVKAAPVILSKKNIRSGKARAIVANAGNANACTGEGGLEDAALTAELVARGLNIEPDQVLVASTGVIGQRLNMSLVQSAVPELVKGLSVDGLPQAAGAIMTTDSFPKISLFEGRAGDTPYRIVGFAKGAGMIMPDMATMLCFVLSDIRIPVDDLETELRTCVDTTFNRITVDGDTSTNDMVLMMASGLAENDPFTEDDRVAFGEGLKSVLWDLSKMIVRDGEGATKLVSVEVKSAVSPEDAGVAARTVANSSLVKTAIYGQDPNWGRILAALGRADIEMREEDVGIWINDVQIVSGGLGLGVEQEKKANEIMTGKEFSLVIDLGQGGFDDRVLTCDLTHEYISINADYRT